VLAGCCLLATGCRATGEAPRTVAPIPASGVWLDTPDPDWLAWLNEPVTVNLRDEPLWRALSQDPAFSTGAYAIRDRRAYDTRITLKAKQRPRRELLERLARDYRLMIALLPPGAPERLEIIAR